MTPETEDVDSWLAGAGQNGQVLISLSAAAARLVAGSARSIARHLPCERRSRSAAGDRGL
jgi:hypothetical protein